MNNVAIRSLSDLMDQVYWTLGSVGLDTLGCISGASVVLGTVLVILLRTRKT